MNNQEVGSQLFDTFVVYGCLDRLLGGRTGSGIGGERFNQMEGRIFCFLDAAILSPISAIVYPILGIIAALSCIIAAPVALGLAIINAKRIEDFDNAFVTTGKIIVGIFSAIVVAAPANILSGVRALAGAFIHPTLYLS